MSKTRLIWGIICLALAALIVVVPYVLPAVTITFTVDGADAPWVPPVVLGVLGIVLLDSARRGEPETDPAASERIVDEEKAALNKRLEVISWGCFLAILIAATFVPPTVVTRGVWSIAVGVILLGVNVARYFLEIVLSGPTTLLGAISLIGGVMQLLGVPTLYGVILLTVIVVGAYLALRPWFRKQELFGEAGQA